MWGKNTPPEPSVVSLDKKTKDDDDDHHISHNNHASHDHSTTTTPQFPSHPAQDDQIPGYYGIESHSQNQQPIPWNQVHFQTCVQLHRLCATTQQVIQFVQNKKEEEEEDNAATTTTTLQLYENHDSSNLITIRNNDNDECTVVAAAQEIVQQWNHDKTFSSPPPPTANTSSSSTLYRWTGAVASTVSRKVWNLILQDDDDDDDDDDDYDDDPVEQNTESYKEEDDFEKKDTTKISPHVHIVNKELVMACIQIIWKHSQQHSSTILPVALYLDPSPPPPTTTTTNDHMICHWNEWLSQIVVQVDSHQPQDTPNNNNQNVQDLFTQMDMQDTYLIAHVMELMGYATLQQQSQSPEQSHDQNTPNKPIIILWGSKKSHEEQRNNVLQQQEVIAKLQLQKVQQSLERHIHQWTTKAEHAHKSVLRVKQQQSQQRTSVLHYFKIQKLYEQKVQTAQHQLVSIEQALQTLEQARTQHDMVSAMKSTTLALEGLRTSSTTSLSDIDDMRNEYQEEVDHVRQVEDVLTTTSNNGIVDGGDGKDDEEEELLLAELEQLMIQDSPPRIEQPPQQLPPLPQLGTSNQGEEDTTTTTTNTEMEFPTGTKSSSEHTTRPPKVQIQAPTKRVALPS